MCVILAICLCAGTLYIAPIVKAENSQMQSSDTYIDSIEQKADGNIVTIAEGYDSATHVVLSARLKSRNTLLYDWSKNVCIGVSGTDAWTNYAFQFVYGTNSNQNLIKLTNGYGEADGIGASQEQWYNNSKLERLFADEGIDIRVIRFHTWAYLLADMGDGFELIGKMILPEDAPTQFTLYNNKTEVRMSKITVETGMDAVLSAMEGIDLTISRSAHYFPVNSENWTLEGKMAIDFSTFDASSDYYLFAGPDQWEKCVSVVYDKASNAWVGRDLLGWSSAGMAEEYQGLFDEAKGGLWVRWIRQNNMLSLWVSKDNTTWSPIISRTDIGNQAGGLYIKSEPECIAKLKDIKLSTECDIPEVMEQSNNGITIISGNYNSEKYAVLDATIQATDGVVHDWSKSVLLSVSGNAVWGDNYDFQLCYGSNENQNLVKLPYGGCAFDGINVPQEQWINRVDFEKIFSEDGMDIKLIRLNTWAYLLADMGNGYELIGRMHVPEDQPTEFAIYNGNTALRISDWSVKTGKENALIAMDGMSFENSAIAWSFPVDNETWAMEGRLALNDFNWGDYRLDVGTISSTEKHLTITWQTGWANPAWAWLSHETDTWGYVWIPQGYHTNLGDGSTGGVWTRWVLDEGVLSLYLSLDREVWELIYSNPNIGEGAKGIYISEATNAHKDVFKDVSIRTSNSDATYAEMSANSIAVLNSPTKTSYYAGDEFDATGLEIVLKKGNDVIRTVSMDDCVISPKRELKATDTKVTVSYRGFKIDVPITVSERKITKVELKDLPYQTEYKKGAAFNISGATYLATYNNGDSIEFDVKSEMCSAVDTNESGKKTVQVNIPYEGTASQFSFVINVKSDPVKYKPSIPLSTQNNNQTDGNQNGTANTPEAGSPQTGDSNHISFYVCMILLASVCVLAQIAKKKRTFERK